jgi:CheY-like chemotaxis protein
MKNDSVPRILVVEDEPDIAALIAYQLTREGYRVETAGTGREALQAVGRDIPDLVVLDRMLPGIGGDEILRSRRTVSRDSSSGRTTISRSRSAPGSSCSAYRPSYGACTRPALLPGDASFGPAPSAWT